MGSRYDMAAEVFAKIRGTKEMSEMLIKELEKMGAHDFVDRARKLRAESEANSARMRREMVRTAEQLAPLYGITFSPHATDEDKILTVCVAEDERDPMDV